MRYIVRPNKRVPAAVQIGFEPPGAVRYTIPKDTLEEWLASLRPGEECGASDAALLPELKSRKNPDPVPDLFRIAKAIRKSGANFVETSTGRTFATDYEEILADAVQQIRTGHRAGMRGKAGRKPNAFTDEQIDQFEREWFSKKHANRRDMTKAIKAAWVAKHGRKEAARINLTAVRRALQRAGKI